MTWITKDNGIIATKEDLPEGCYGFVYRIDNLTNSKSYIGKKQCFSVTKKKLSKRSIESAKDKRSLKKYRSKGVWVYYEESVKESNWKDYTGSNKDLLEDISNGHPINKIILEFAFSKAHLTYLEVKYQFIYEVLESDKWYNSNILAKFFPNIFEFKVKSNED